MCRDRAGRRDNKKKKERKDTNGGDSGVNMSAVDLGHSLRSGFYRAS